MRRRGTSGGGATPRRRREEAEQRRDLGAATRCLEVALAPLPAASLLPLTEARVRLRLAALLLRSRSKGLPPPRACLAAPLLPELWRGYPAGGAMDPATTEQLQGGQIQPSGDGAGRSSGEGAGRSSGEGTERSSCGRWRLAGSPSLFSSPAPNPAPLSSSAPAVLGNDN
uniref:Uncharacterized protein n=1 Tax=Oryza nivara TaxID=4536 RepID=A0A0E0H0Y4_ORYNI